MSGYRGGFLSSLLAMGVAQVVACSVDTEGHTFGKGGTDAAGNAGKSSNAGGTSGFTGGGTANGGSVAGKGGAATGTGGAQAGAANGGSSQSGGAVGSGGVLEGGTTGIGEGGEGAATGGTGGAGEGGAAEGGATTGGSAQGGAATGGSAQAGAGQGGVAQGGAGGTVSKGGSAGVSNGGSGGGTSCGTGCKNGGTCNTSGICVCKAGYKGTFCETNIDDCAAAPCKNSGTCVDGVNAYTCQCKGGWVGTTCSEAVFQGLGVLSGGTDSRAFGVSSDGTTVVGESTVGGKTTAFHWKLASGMQALPAPSDGLTYGTTTARAVSANGLMVVGGAYPTTGQPYRGILWVAGQVSTVYQGQTASGAISSAMLSAVNQDGSIVAGSEERDGDGSRAVRWTSEGRANLVAASYDTSSPQGMTPDGNVVVGSTSDPATAFRWTSAGAVHLPCTTGSTWASASAINADGTVIVGACDETAARWVNGAAPTSLGIPGSARAVSANGSVIVGTTSQGTAFIWQGTLSLLSETLTAAGANLTSWSLNEATGISGNGKVIVGTGVVGGVNQAFIARLP